MNPIGFCVVCGSAPSVWREAGGWRCGCKDGPSSRCGSYLRDTKRGAIAEWDAAHAALSSTNSALTAALRECEELIVCRGINGVAQLLARVRSALAASGGAKS